MTRSSPFWPALLAFFFLGTSALADDDFKPLFDPMKDGQRTYRKPDEDINEEILRRRRDPEPPVELKPKQVVDKPKVQDIDNIDLEEEAKKATGKGKSKIPRGDFLPDPAASNAPPTAPAAPGTTPPKPSNNVNSGATEFPPDVTTPERTRPTRRKKGDRKVAFEEDPSSASRTRVLTPKSDDYDLRAGVFAGFSNLSAADGATQAARDANKLTQNFIVGASAEGTAWRYWGAEFEGFFGIAPSQSGQGTTRSLQQIGAMLNVSVQAPFYIEYSRWVPRLGLGYGLFALKHSADDVNDSVASAEQVSGPYMVVGFIGEPFRKFLIQFDYAFSFGASGKYSTLSDVHGTSNSSLSGAKFDRLRLGAYGRLIRNFLLGLQYTKRGLHSSQPNPAAGNTEPTGNEGMSQVMGVMLYEL